MAEFGNLFTGKLVRLAALTNPEFAEAQARWSNDAEYMRLGYVRHATPASPARVQRHMDKHKDQDNDFSFAIRTLEDDKLIGDIDLHVTWSHQHAKMGIGIGEPDYRSKGYGSDAVRLICRYGFQELGLWRIQLNVFSNNPRAIRAYEKVGFTHEVRYRSALYRDGERLDELIMGLLRPEWEAQEAALQEA